MPFVGRGGIPLPLEDVTEVATAIRTDYFGADHAERAVLVAGDGTRDAVKVRRPSTAGFKLVARFIQRGVAPGASVDAGIREELVILPGEGCLSPLLPEDSELLCDVD